MPHQTISCYRTEDRTYPFELPEDAAVPSGVESWTLDFSVYASQQSSTALVNVTTAGGAIGAPDASTGDFSVTLSSAVLSSADLPVGAYVFRLFRTNSGSRRLLAWGTFVVNP